MATMGPQNPTLAQPGSDPVGQGIQNRVANYGDASLDATVVHNTTDESIDDVKTFVKSPIVPTPTTDYQAATKKYVDDAVPVPSYGGTYEFNETGSAIALTSSVAFYRWITGQAGTVKGDGYVTWDNAAAPTGKRLVVGASGAGVYMVVATYSGNLAKKGDLEGVIYVNATIQNNIRSDQKVIEDAQYTAGSVMGIVTLAAGDTVSLWFGSSVASNTLTLKHANLTLVRIDP